MKASLLLTQKTLSFNKKKPSLEDIKPGSFKVKISLLDPKQTQRKFPVFH